MLHVILLILKILGILLAVLLGLALLLIGLALFVPVRYRVEAKRYPAADVFYAKGRLSWLFRLVSIPISYEKGEFSAKLKLLGITAADLTEEEPEPPVKKKAKKQKVWKKKRAAEEDGKKKEEHKADSKEPVFPKEEKETPSAFMIPSAPTVSEKADIPSVSRPKAEEKEEKENHFFGKFWQKLKRTGQFLVSFVRKILNIKYTIRRFCDKMRTMKQKTEEFREFLSDERTKGAFRLVFGQTGYLLKRFLPRKLRGTLYFGTEDPALTGQILGGLGIFYPLFKDNVKVYPDFAEARLEGELFAKGRIRLITVLRVAWKLWRDKNIRFVYQKFTQ